MPTQDDLIRTKILGELRSLQLRKSTDHNLKNKVINIGSMSKGSGYGIGVINRICSEMEDEGLIRWTSKKVGGDPTQSRRTFDITAEGRQLLDLNTQGEPGTNGDNGAGYPGAYDPAYDSAGGSNSGSNAKTIKQINVDAVSDSVRISCQTLLLSVDEFSEIIRGRNEFAVENPETHSEITKFLVELREQIEQLIKLLPEDKGSATNSTIEKLSDWHTNTGIHVHHKMHSYFTPEYIGENASPLILVGIFTSVCAALSGALGIPPATGAVVGGVTAATYVGKGKTAVKEIQ